MSKRVVPDKDFVTSPVLEVVIQHGIGYEGVLFSSDFPTLDEFIVLSSTKIRTVRYMGEITDDRTVQFLNAHTHAYPEDGFEIIKMEI